MCPSFPLKTKVYVELQPGYFDAHSFQKSLRDQISSLLMLQLVSRRTTKAKAQEP